MATGWFIAPYKRRVRPQLSGIVRYCAMNDFNVQIQAFNGGRWAETEVLGQHAIVKVRASAATMTAIANTAGFTRIPVAALDDTLSSLTTAQKNAIRNKVQALGYTLAELQERFPNDLGTYTLRQLLMFVAQRRRLVRYDAGTDSIIDDGPDQPVRPLADVDGVVS